MTDSALGRTGAVALMASGCASMLFWIMAASAGTFAGAAVVQQAAWIPAQTLHVIAALLAVFGFMSVYAAERHRAGVSGLIAFVLVTTGNVLFFVDGVIALVIFPSLARSIPAALETSGAMNQGTTLVLFITIAAINMIGQVAFGAITWRAGVFPRPAAALLVIGGTLFNLPPGPVPMIVLAVGGVLWVWPPPGLDGRLPASQSKNVSLECPVFFSDAQAPSSVIVGTSQMACPWLRRRLPDR